jgi:alpha-amylase
MYYSIKDVWAGGKTMYTIRNRYNEEQSKFKDISALGVFVDNHDNARFLNFQKNIHRFKNALAFSIYSIGIPFVYYGNEQGYAGGNDP